MLKSVLVNKESMHVKNPCLPEFSDMASDWLAAVLPTDNQNHVWKYLF